MTRLKKDLTRSKSLRVRITKIKVKIAKATKVAIVKVIKAIEVIIAIKVIKLFLI